MSGGLKNHWLRRLASLPARCSTGRHPGRHDGERRRARRYVPLSETLEGRALMAAGDLDPTFGTGGTGAIIADSYIDFQEANAIAFDGNELVLAGNFASTIDHYSQVALYSTDGAPESLVSLPEGFLSGVFTSLQGQSGRSGATGLAIQPDGKIVVVGSTGEGIGIARLNADGSLDSTFGEQTLALTPLDADETAEGVAIQPNGQIVVAGSYTDISNPNGLFVSDVVRYNANGSLDQTFGQGGVLPLDFSSDNLSLQVTSVAMDGNDIMLAGTVAGPGFSNARVFVIDLTPSGSFNTGFGTSGIALTNLPDIGGSVSAIVMPGSGNVVLATTSDAGFALVQYLRDGQPDSSFGTQGVMSFGFDGGDAVADDLALDPGGGIIVVGSAEVYGTWDFALARVLPSGALDPGFGIGGEVSTSPFQFSPETADDLSAQAVAIDGEGRIVVGGYAGLDQSDQYLALARYEGVTSSTTPSPSSPTPTSTSTPTSTPNSTSTSTSKPIGTTTPSPTPPKVAATGVTRGKKGLVSIIVYFNEPLVPSSASTTGFYQVAMGGKKKRRLVYSRPVGIVLTTYDAPEDAVWIDLAKEVKGPVQLTVDEGIRAADGAVSRTDTTMVV